MAALRCGPHPIESRRRTGDTRVMIRVALLDDHPAVVAGLRRLIDEQPGLHVTAAAASADQLARQLGKRRVDVLVMDAELGRGDGLAHCRRIKNRTAPPAVIIYAAAAEPSLVLAAQAAQADAVVDKSAPVTGLFDAIQRVAAGEPVFPEVPREAYASAVARIDDEDLPVLAMLLDGEPVTSIAQTLRRDASEIAWRAQRIVGRLRTPVRIRADEAFR
jgi:DNA-binding NarL/FixJ family response regulator